MNHIEKNLNILSRTAKEAEKNISNVENQLNGSGGADWGSNFISVFSASGLGDMTKDLIQNIGTSYATSAFGSDTGTMASSVLSGMVTGAMIGKFIPIPVVNAAAGAVIGGLIGLANGSMQVFEKKDDFFKDYYNNLYEGRLSASEAALTAGSTTAGSREQSYKAFEKLLGGSAQANKFLDQLIKTADTTPFQYDDLTGLSKTLLMATRRRRSFPR